MLLAIGVAAIPLFAVFAPMVSLTANVPGTGGVFTTVTTQEHKLNTSLIGPLRHGERPHRDDRA